MYIYIYCIIDADNLHCRIRDSNLKTAKKTKKVLSLLISSVCNIIITSSPHKLDFLLGFFSFSWPLDRLVDDEGLFFTRPKHLKTSRAVKKSIAAGFVNNLRHVSHNAAKRKGKAQADWNDHRLGMTAWGRPYLANSFADTAFEDNGCSDVSFRDICEREGAALKETRNGSYFLEKFRLRLMCSKFAHSKHAQYKLVPSPFRSYALERGLELEGGNAKIKKFRKLAPGKLRWNFTASFHQVSLRRT